jgi:hypothetical protein
VNNIRATPHLPVYSVWARLPRLKAELKTLFAAAGMSIVSACNVWQNQENTLDQISTLDNLRYSQLLTNVANAMDQKDSVPSQGVASSGTATNVTSGGLTAILINPFNLGHNTNTLNSTAMLNWQNAWTVTPVSDPQDLQNLRALYGLLYRNDRDIAEVIQNTILIYKSSEAPLSSLESQAETNCGISLGDPSKKIPPEVVKFAEAITAYFQGLRAFPADTSASKGAPASPPVSSAADIQNSSSSKYRTSSANHSPSKNSISSTDDSSTNSKCFGFPLSAFGVTSGQLAMNYGLLYPSIRDVWTALRNGLSPACRKYQIDHLTYDTPLGRVFPNNIIFVRWLFWRDARGGWAPYAPPEDAPLEYLGRYVNRDFWTTAPACLSDFIVIAINATANSHAAAQNTPKPTGTTPAPTGSM